MMRTIEVKNGVKCFGEQQVLRDVSIQCASGHIYGIVGHNGSGKTVLFKCICAVSYTHLTLPTKLEV